MTRFDRLAAALVVGLSLFVTASAQEPALRPTGSNMAFVTAASAGLPGHPMLQNEFVQNEVGLTSQQKEKLGEVASKYADMLKSHEGIDITRLGTLTPEERRTAQKEISERYLKRVEGNRRQIEEVLTPKQLDQLKEIEFRQRTVAMLRLPPLAEQVNLTDQQKQTLRQIREETQVKIMRIERESQDKIAALLTADQTKKLHEMIEKNTVPLGPFGPMGPTRQPPTGPRDK